MNGTIPRWATVLLLCLLAWLLKNYADGLNRTLADHNLRITAVEMWKAGVEAGRNK